MAESYNAYTAAELCDLIEAVTGNTVAGNALAYLKAGYLRFLSGTFIDATGVESHHDWTFMRSLATITVGGAVTGTGTNVSGTLTATASIFNLSMIGQTITVTDYDGAGTDLEADITGYTSGTVVTIDDTTAFAGKAISVESNGIYQLPADFGGLDGPVVYAYRAGEGSPPLKPASQRTIMAMWRETNRTSDTFRYAIVAREFAAATGQRYDLMMAPLPDESMQWLIPYRVLAGDITDSASIYLLGGSEHGLTVLECALAEYESRAGQVSGPHTVRAERMMRNSARLDRRQVGSKEPPNLLAR